MEGLIFGGAYLGIASNAGVFKGARFLRDEKRTPLKTPAWRLIYGGKFAFQNRLGQPYRWKGIYSFWFVLLCICLRAIFKYKPPGGLYLEGRFNGRFFAFRVLGAYTWRGLFSEFYRIAKKRVFSKQVFN